VFIESKHTEAENKMYNSITDAKTTLDNSGVAEWFDYDSLEEVVSWMYNNDATPEQAAEYFEVV